MLKDRLKQVRKNLPGKVTQEQFAKILGTTRSAIATYETGSVVPKDQFLKLISKEFQLTLPMPKGRGFLRSLIRGLAPDRHIPEELAVRIPLFSKGLPKAPYTVPRNRSSAYFCEGCSRLRSHRHSRSCRLKNDTGRAEYVLR